MTSSAKTRSTKNRALAHQKGQVMVEWLVVAAALVAVLWVPWPGQGDRNLLDFLILVFNNLWFGFEYAMSLPV